MTPDTGGFWDLVSIASPFAKFILFILMGMSILSWTVILDKSLMILRVRKANREFLNYRWRSFDPRQLLAESRRYTHAITARAYQHMHHELFERATNEQIDGELVGREFARAAADQLRRAERYLPFLATCSSAAPFLGLLGTVWGIISAFQRIGIWGSANIAVVAPGIAEALVATALGLFAAIPALVAFNFYSTWIRKEAEKTEQFGDDLIFAYERMMRTQPASKRTTPTPAV